MKRLVLLLLLVPATLLAQNAFDGTWRTDPHSTQVIGHDNYLLQNGVYKCSSCVPKIEVKADGQDHQVTGSPYYDTVNVRVDSDHSIEIVYKKNSKPTQTNKVTASDDGKTSTTEFTFTTEGGQQGNGKFTSTRVGTVPENANKISGEWQPERLESASESVVTITYKVVDNGLSMTDQQGDSYTAKFDGKDYPVKGDPGTTSVSLKKVDDNTIEETDKRNGKVISIARMTVQPDGKTMSVAVEDKLSGKAYKYTADKQ